MRLLQTSTHELSEFSDADVPPYAILSHRWGPEEVSHQEYRKNRNLHKSGYAKITEACDFAQALGHEWLWIDTCCIDKRSSAELSEAINSMYQWYAEAEECIAYLFDVAAMDEPTRKYVHRAVPHDHFRALERAFRDSEWFTRGWTLQELIAPRYVTFCTSHWNVIGSKHIEYAMRMNPVDRSEPGSRKLRPRDPRCDIVQASPLTRNEDLEGPRDRSLSATLQDITGIPTHLLINPENLQDYSAAQKFSWAATRETTRTEDEAYCLLGLFGVSIPLLYGERQKAMRRLQAEIMTTSIDESMLAWRTDSLRHVHDAESVRGLHMGHYDLLATSAAVFEGTGFVTRNKIRGTPRFTMQSGLLRLHIDTNSEVFQLDHRLFLVQLRCRDGVGEGILRFSKPCYILIRGRSCGHYQRIETHDPEKYDFEAQYPRATWKPIHVGDFYMHASGPC